MLPKRTRRAALQAIRGGMAGLLAVVMMSGGHWFLLQTVAWARMFVAYSQVDSMGSALVKTFDGQHPCALCQQVRQGQKEEQEKGNPVPRERFEKSPELFCGGSCPVGPIKPIAVVEASVAPPDFYADFIEAPPTPPPRTSVGVL